MSDKKISIEVLDELAEKFGNTNVCSGNFSAEEKERLNEIFSKKDGFKIKSNNGTCLTYISGDLIEKTRNKKNNNEVINVNADNDIVRADGTFNPLLALYSGKIKDTFKQKLNCFGVAYHKAENNECGYTEKEADVSDFIYESEYEGNPFAMYTNFDEELENVIYPGDVNDYYDNHVTDNEAIKIENHSKTRTNMARNTRQAFIVKRNMLNEMSFERVKAEEYIRNAINNKITEMKIRKMQLLVYNSLFVSNKFTTGGSKYNEEKDNLFVNNTPWSQQSPEQFFKSISNLQTLWSKMDSERIGEKNVIAMSRQEIADLKKPFYPTQFVNNTWLFANARTRLGALFAAGTDIIVECLGFDKFNTYFKYDTQNKVNVALYKKELFKYANVLKPGVIHFGDVSDVNGIIDKSKYTFTSPIDMSILAAEIHTPLLTGSFKYESEITPFSFKFSL